MLVDHLANYRRALPLGLIFAGVSIAAIVIFIVYAAKWNELSSTERYTGSSEGNKGYEERTRTEYGYYASVISLLVLIVFFNGYHLTKL
jgi:hypothetical protein